MVSQVQSILFDKRWTEAKAHKWLLDHNFKDKGVDQTELHLRYRQFAPFTLKRKGYTRFRTIDAGTSGIQFVIAFM